MTNVLACCMDHQAAQHQDAQNVNCFVMLGMCAALAACSAPKQQPRPANQQTHKASTGDCFPMNSNSCAEIGHTLDRLHAAASAADFDVYFSFFTPNAVFIGTDPKERWNVDDFKAYTKPFFSQGKGWTYLPRQRHIVMTDDRDDCSLAWFDELLWNDKYLWCRGSGVVRRGSDNQWRLEQYVLSFAIANEVAKDATNLRK